MSKSCCAFFLWDQFCAVNNFPSQQKSSLLLEPLYLTILCWALQVILIKFRNLLAKKNQYTCTYLVYQINAKNNQLHMTRLRSIGITVDISVLHWLFPKLLLEILAIFITLWVHSKYDNLIMTELSNSWINSEFY